MFFGLRAFVSKCLLKGLGGLGVRAWGLGLLDAVLFLDSGFRVCRAQ